MSAPEQPDLRVVPPWPDNEPPDDEQADPNGPEPAVWILLKKTPPKKRGGAAHPTRSPWNLGTILRHDSRWRGRLRFNAMRGEEEILEGGLWRPLIDVDDVNLCRWVSEIYSVDFATGTAREQVMSVAAENPVHPVRAYLDALMWDGTKRLPSMLSDYFGAEDSILHKSIGRAWMVSMVARVYEPGCKVDTVPILIGKQGTRKSSTIRAMVPDVSWFSDSDIPLHHAQDQYQVIRGKWIYELAEFDRFSTKVDASKVKAYVTQQIDSYRESYGRRTVDRPRQVGFVGTTNAQEFFVDATGSRRFWPIKCGDCNPEAMANARDQLWAEAVRRYRAKHGWLLSDQDSKAVAEIADEFRVGDSWDSAVETWLAAPLRQQGVTVAEILEGALEIKPADQDPGSVARVAKILVRLEWVKAGRSGPRGKGARLWKPPASPAKPI